MNKNEPAVKIVFKILFILTIFITEVFSSYSKECVTGRASDLAPLARGLL